MNSKSKSTGGNVPRMAAVQELRRSGAAGKHDPRPNRQRTRATQKAKAYSEYR